MSDSDRTTSGASPRLDANAHSDDSDRKAARPSVPSSLCGSSSLRGGVSVVSSSSTLGSLRESSRGGESAVQRRRQHRTRRRERWHQRVCGGVASLGVPYVNAPHVPLLPSHITLLPILLDPFPNATILSVSVVIDTLLTTQRSGVRLYRCGAQCVATPDTAVPTTATPRDLPGALPKQLPGGVTDAVGPAVEDGGDVWGLVEARDGLQLQDAYLSCVASVPCTTTYQDTHDATVADTPYARYFCVATGSDRTLHSVCVMSTRGHFVLHHELHGHNKVVCMQLALIPTRALQPHVCLPLVVSVDEVGEVVLYDVQRRSAARLQRHGGLSSTNLLASIDVIAEGDVTDERVAACERTVLESLDAVEATRPYRLESGLATRVALVGPCVELCTHCHNLFCPSAGAARQGEGYIALSLFIASRARDVVREEHRSTAAAAGDALDEAELHVTFVRLLWDRTRAFVLHEADVVREAAPVAVCEAGVAMCAPTYRPGQPQTVLLARPRLRLWRLSGCTGRHLQTLRVYDEEEGSGHGSRAAHEYFLDWLPLGRHVLQLSTMSAPAAATLLLPSPQTLPPPQPLCSHAGASLNASWDCAAATTDDYSVLLLGAEPMTARTSSSVACATLDDGTPARQAEQSEDAVATKNTPGSPDGSQTERQTSRARHYSTASAMPVQLGVTDLPGGLQERQQLEAWLSERSPVEVPTTPPLGLSPGGPVAERCSPDVTRPHSRHNSSNDDGRSRPGAARLDAAGLTKKAYTVLAQLYSAVAQRTVANKHNQLAASVTGLDSHETDPSRGCNTTRTTCGRVQVMYHSCAHALLLFLPASETILQLSLPFLPASHTPGKTDTAQSDSDSHLHVCLGHDKGRGDVAAQSSTASRLAHDCVAVAPEQNGASAPSAMHVWPFSLSKVAGDRGASLARWAPSVRLTAPLQRWLAEGKMQRASSAPEANATPTPPCFATAPPVVDTAQDETMTTPNTTLPRVLPSLEFSLMRPLASAVLRWTEGGVDQTPVLSPAPAPPPLDAGHFGSPATVTAPPPERGSHDCSLALLNHGEGGGGDGDVQLGGMQGGPPSAHAAVDDESASPPSSPCASESRAKSIVTVIQEDDAAGTATQPHVGRRTDSPSASAMPSSSCGRGRVAAVRISIRATKSDSRRRSLQSSSAAVLPRASRTTSGASRSALSISSESAHPAGVSESGSLSARQRAEFVRQQVCDMLRPSLLTAATTASCGAPLGTPWGGNDTASTLPTHDAILATTTTAMASPARPRESIEAALTRARELRRLVLHAEPRARQAIVYAWQDGHDALYIRRSVALDELDERNARRRAVARALRMRCERGVWADLICLNDTAMTTCVNVSVRFFTQFLARRAERRCTCNRRGLFDFARYFAAGVVPQSLRDLQERDKCKFELADLQLRQEAELAALDPYDTVTLYQNEEKRPVRLSSPSSRLTWQPHATFAFDDADGNVVDLAAYNASATLAVRRAMEAKVTAPTNSATTTTTTLPASPRVTDPGSPNTAGGDGGVGSFLVAALRPRGEGATTWAWASPSECSSVSTSTSSSRTKALTRELQRWQVGPWRYAAQWPTHQVASEQNSAAVPLWTDEECAESRVRRRSLTRRRVNLTVKAAREQLAATHAQQLEALRRELGL